VCRYFICRLNAARDNNTFSHKYVLACRHKTHKAIPGATVDVTVSWTCLTGVASNVSTALALKTNTRQNQHSVFAILTVTVLRRSETLRLGSSQPKLVEVEVTL